MKLDTMIEGYQRKYECKNCSSIISNYWVISLPNFVMIGLSEAYLSVSIERI